MKKENANRPKPTEGYPPYPKHQDIYKQEDEDKSVDPDDMDEVDEETDPDNVQRGSTMVDVERMGEDLDVPGSELDDSQEEIGSEDEENNYYSLGGEKDLEEKHPDDV
jgi:hypothetical protein